MHLRILIRVRILDIKETINCTHTQITCVSVPKRRTFWFIQHNAWRIKRADSSILQLDEEEVDLHYGTALSTRAICVNTHRHLNKLNTAVLLLLSAYCIYIHVH
jgi:hypothetical protein